MGVLHRGDADADNPDASDADTRDRCSPVASAEIRRLTNAPWGRASPSLVWNGCGWAVAWVDGRHRGNWGGPIGYGGDIFFQRLAPDGEPLAEPTVITRDGAPQTPQLAWNGETYAIAFAVDHNRDDEREKDGATRAVVHLELLDGEGGPLPNRFAPQLGDRNVDPHLLEGWPALRPHGDGWVLLYAGSEGVHRLTLEADGALRHDTLHADPNWSSRPQLMVRDGVLLASAKIGDEMHVWTPAGGAVFSAPPGAVCASGDHLAMVRAGSDATDSVRVEIHGEDGVVGAELVAGAVRPMVHDVACTDGGLVTLYSVVDGCQRVRRMVLALTGYDGRRKRHLELARGYGLGRGSLAIARRDGLQRGSSATARRDGPERGSLGFDGDLIGVAWNDRRFGRGENFLLVVDSQHWPEAPLDPRPPSPQVASDCAAVAPIPDVQATRVGLAVAAGQVVGDIGRRLVRFDATDQAPALVHDYGANEHWKPRLVADGDAVLRLVGAPRDDPEVAGTLHRSLMGGGETTTVDIARRADLRFHSVAPHPDGYALLGGSFTVSVFVTISPDGEVLSEVVTDDERVEVRLLPTGDGYAVLGWTGGPLAAARVTMGRIDLAGRVVSPAVLLPGTLEPMAPDAVWTGEHIVLAWESLRDELTVPQIDVAVFDRGGRQIGPIRHITSGHRARRSPSLA